MTQNVSTSRCVALVGPYLSGKTSLMESILFRTGATHRKGSVNDGNAVGDGSPEAKTRGMSTELSVSEFSYLDENWSVIDCPGSAELIQETQNALMVADMAVVVCEPAAERAVTVAPILHFLDSHQIPHIIFINKMDTPGASARSTFEALQGISERPLLLREIPIRDGDAITGFVDLVSERAFAFKDDKPAELIKMPADLSDEEQLARGEMLESLADFDDDLMEALLEDMVPSTDDIYANMTKDLRQDLVVPVFFGSAGQDYGLTRLLKALRHEGPEFSATLARNGIETGGEANVAQVFKTLQGGASGKLSLARVWAGEVKEGMHLNGNRVGGVMAMMGQQTTKIDGAQAGRVVGLARMEDVHTGDVLSEGGKAAASDWPETPQAQFSLAIHPDKRGDEVKLTTGLAKVAEEDPSFTYATDPDTNELVIHGQGDVHLRIALARLENRYGLKVSTSTPRIPYKETIRKPVSQHARHKKQSGGHGEFGDVHLDIKPRARGEGFEFTDTIAGGVVPKQYIPAVEAGVKEYLSNGPLGFNVVDLAVTLTDGQFHAVDSSDMAFRKAAQQAMREGMPKCGPVLLEPVMKVRISVPNDVTPKVQRLVSGRRGQLLGFDAKPGWHGWDVVDAQMPQSEIQDMIIELRSLSVGIGSFEAEFDHLAELTGKVADQIVASRAEQLQG